MSSHGHTHDEYVPPPGMKHETKDISTRVVVWFAISLVTGAAPPDAAPGGTEEHARRGGSHPPGLRLG
jgi:hypothetical protein